MVTEFKKNLASFLFLNFFTISSNFYNQFFNKKSTFILIIIYFRIFPSSDLQISNFLIGFIHQTIPALFRYLLRDDLKNSNVNFGTFA
jgi:hypothetical protein